MFFRSSSTPRSSTSSRSQPRSSEDQEPEQKERRLSVYLQERAHEKWVSEGIKERDFVPTDVPERTRAERVEALRLARKEKAKENSKWVGGLGHLIAG